MRPEPRRRHSVPMSASNGDAGRVARVAVSLRGGAPERSHFLAEHEVVLVDGVAEPIEYDGRRYVFSHVRADVGYGSTDARVYVFSETA